MADAEGFDELLQNLERFEQQTDQALRTALTNISAHAAQRAEANAPILKGDLRASLQPVPVEVQGEQYTSGVNSDKEYALYMHEGLLPYGDGTYQLGPISAQQPDTPEGGVGGKFIERVQNYYAQQYQQIIGASINGEVIEIQSS